jgi:hypothetical protein
VDAAAAAQASTYGLMLQLVELASADVRFSAFAMRVQMGVPAVHKIQ